MQQPRYINEINEGVSVAQRIDSLAQSINQRFPRIICNNEKNYAALKHTRLREFALHTFTSQQFKILQRGCNPNIATDNPSRELQARSSWHYITYFFSDTTFVQCYYSIHYAHSDNRKNT